MRFSWSSKYPTGTRAKNCCIASSDGAKKVNDSPISLKMTSLGSCFWKHEKEERKNVSDLALAGIQVCLLRTKIQKRETGGKRDWQTDRVIDRQTDRETDRETDRQTETETERQRQRNSDSDRETETQRQRQRDKERERQREKERVRQADRQTEANTDRETRTDIDRGKHRETLTDKQRDRQSNKHQTNFNNRLSPQSTHIKAIIGNKNNSDARNRISHLRQSY